MRIFFVDTRIKRLIKTVDSIHCTVCFILVCRELKKLWRQDPDAAINKNKINRHSDVMMSAMGIKWPSFRLFSQPFVEAQIKENIKALRHRPLWIHQWPVKSPHKGPVTRKTSSFDDVIVPSRYFHSHRILIWLSCLYSGRNTYSLALRPGFAIAVPQNPSFYFQFKAFYCMSRHYDTTRYFQL